LGSYITAAQMVTYTGSALTTAELEAMITDAEEEVEDRCTVAGVTASTSSYLLKAAVRALVMAAVYDRGIMDGTMLKSLDRTIFKDVDASKFEETAQRKIDTFAAIQGGAEQESSESFEETIVREDHQMASLNPDQTIIKEHHDRADETGNQDTDFGGS
jgi:hypothetical protein